MFVSVNLKFFLNFEILFRKNFGQRSNCAIAPVFDCVGHHFRDDVGYSLKKVHISVIGKYPLVIRFSHHVGNELRFDFFDKFAQLCSIFRRR